MLSNRSVTLSKLGRLGEALESCERALAARPDYADALYNRGNVLFALVRPEEAVASFEAALRLEPRLVDAWNNLGLALFVQQKYPEAIATYDRALALDPAHLQALHNRASALAGLESYDEALTACDKVLSLAPDHVDTLNTRGIVLGKLKRHQEALDSYDRALALAPDRIDIEANRGTTLIELDRLEDAVASFETVFASNPDHVIALINCANALVRINRAAEALAKYDRALELNPGNSGAISGGGVALTILDRLDEALARHDEALCIEPDLIPAHVNRGNTLVCMARHGEAVVSYGNALALEPEHVDANFNSAVTRLCLGDFEKGWKQYEYRWKRKGIAWQPWEFTQPIWRGDEDVSGKTIFLLAEQGLGDTINFVRYAPLLAARGAKVILGVQKPLKDLACTVPGISGVLVDGQQLPDFDLHCPMLGLPIAFRTDLASIPANVPYLQPYHGRLDAWRSRMPQTGRMRVGIVWSGNSGHANDRKRSIALERFAAVLSAPEIDFISVQKDVSEAQAAILDAHGVLQLGQHFTDFADTAAVVAMLDLLVAVDTSVAHLAGAMGKAVALLLPFSPDWRWLMHRSDSPWYPSMRLYRQPAFGDWDTPLQLLRQELTDVASRAGKRP